MPGGPVCCLLGPCCPPGGAQSREKKIQYLTELMTASSKEPDQQSAATYVIDNFDLVPKGLGTAIVEAYRPEFESFFKTQ